jgi:hypothetical protein
MKRGNKSNHPISQQKINEIPIPSLDLKTLPDDVWREIFIALDSSCFGSDFHFRKIACVSTSWSKMVHEVILICFRKRPAFSNWVLLHFNDSDLESLDLSRSNPIDEDVVAQLRLTNLKELCLNLNMEISPYAIENLTSLTKLSINWNDLITDECLLNFPNLRSLSLQQNSTISGLVLERLPNLDTLDIAFQEEIGDEIKNLTNLTSLRTNYTVTDYSVSKFTNLTELFLTEDNVSNEVLQKLVKLRSLELRACAKINRHGFSKLTDLSTLIFDDHCPLVDADLNCMISLTSLDIDSDVITSSGIQNLTNLTKLRIQKAPNIDDDGIKNLSLLTDLNVNSTNTDESINNLVNLIHLNLEYNVDISEESIKNLINLKSLDCEDNVDEDEERSEGI